MRPIFPPHLSHRRASSTPKPKSNALNNVKNSATKKKINRRNSNFNNHDEQTSDFETDYSHFDHDTTISSIENYHPNQTKRKGSHASQLKNKNSNKNSNSKSNPNPTIDKNPNNTTITKGKIERKLQPYEFDHDEITKTESYEKFYKKRASIVGEEIDDIAELKTCPECSLTFKNEGDKKRHFKVVFWRSKIF